MGATRLQHASVAVPRGRLEECAAFYQDVLGMRRIPNLAAMAWFEFGDADHVHLLEGEPPTSGAHFALQVDDLSETLERARAAGADPVQDVALWGAERWFMHDPAGNRIEVFAEAPPPV